MEMELKSRNVQHARNLFDRAVTLLPRVNQLWYKYVYLEELLQNVPGARQVFERWMQWEPDDKACVLADIFLALIALCVHPSSPFVEPSVTAPPLVVSQVNSVWRRAALDTPELWSSIRVGNNINTEILELWIKRSTSMSISSGTNRPTPLDIHIDAIHTPQDLKGEDYHSQPNVHSSPRNEKKYRETRVGRAWCVLRREFRRWRMVEFVLDVQSACYFLELPSVVWAKWVERLSVLVLPVLEDRDGNGNGIPSYPSQILDYIHAYMIPSVEFKWDSSPLLGAIWHQVWAGLTKIHLSMGLTMDESVTFLRKCVQAEEVALGCITNDEFEVVSETANSDFVFGWARYRYRLPKLESLGIGFDGAVVGCDCTQITQFFTFPALRRLGLRNSNTSVASSMRIVDLLHTSEAEKKKDRDKDENGTGWGFRELLIVDYYMPESILFKLLCTPELGANRVPAVRYYTRRTFRLEFLVPPLEVVRDVGGLEYYQDAQGGTWIGRMGLPDLPIALTCSKI